MPAYVDQFSRLTPQPAARTARQWAELPPEQRRGLFWLAQVEDERLLDHMRRLVDTALQEGISEAEFIYRAKGMLADLQDPGGTPYHDPSSHGATDEERRAHDKDVRHIDSAARLKLIFRTQFETAAGREQWEQTLDPEWLDMFPGWRFVRQPGAKIKRPDHVEHENDVRLVTDYPYWLARNSPDQGGFNNPFPPFGFNSWMTVQPVSREECESLGLLAPGEKIAIPPELDRWKTPDAAGDACAVSLASLSPEGRAHLEQRAAEAGFTLETTADGRTRPAPLPPEDAALHADLLELMQQLDSEPAPGTDPVAPAFLNSYAAWLQTFTPKKTHDARPNTPTLRPAERPARPRDILRLPRQPHRANDDQGGNTQEKAGADLLQHRQAMRDRDAGATRGSGQELGRRISVSEARSRLETQSRDSLPASLANEVISFQAEVTAAQLNAVYAGRKPAFLETSPELVRPFAAKLPQGLRYEETEHAACIYHEQAAARELGMPAGEPLHAAVRRAMVSGDCGMLLGYGAPSILTRPSHQVTITRNGAHFYNFNSAADKATALRYAKERKLDFERQFPKDKWGIKLEFKN